MLLLMMMRIVQHEDDVNLMMVSGRITHTLSLIISSHLCISLLFVLSILMLMKMMMFSNFNALHIKVDADDDLERLRDDLK